MGYMKASAGHGKIRVSDAVSGTARLEAQALPATVAVGAAAVLLGFRPPVE